MRYLVQQELIIYDKGHTMTSILKADEIQDSSGNLIIKEVGDAITIGASGDTITIPSGATIVGTLEQQQILGAQQLLTFVLD